MTLAQLMAAILFSASRWCGALAFHRAAITGVRGPDTWFFPLALAEIVTPLLFAGQSTAPGYRRPDRSCQEQYHFHQEQI
jgi:hypothetical protein